MGLMEIKDNLLGEWVGTNLLKQSWLDPSDTISTTNLSVAPAANGKFITFRCIWSDGKSPQEGLLLLGHDKVSGVATAAWADSWHMSDKILQLEGSIDDEGAISLLGSYEAPPGPDWGWRITVSSDAGKNLHIVMYNISPEGSEEMAVQADYARVS